MMTAHCLRRQLFSYFHRVSAMLFNEVIAFVVLVEVTAVSALYLSVWGPEFPEKQNRGCYVQCS